MKTNNAVWASRKIARRVAHADMERQGIQHINKPRQAAEDHDVSHRKMSAV